MATASFADDRCPTRLDLHQGFFGITKLVDMNIHLVHHAQKQAAHLPIIFAEVVKILPPLDSATPAPKKNDGQLRRVMVAVQHARAEDHH